MRRFLIVMVKEPRPGRVKSRLGRDIGMVAAAWWFRHQVARLLRDVEDPRWQVVLAVSPDHAGLNSRVWPAHLPRVAQGAGDLGDRMGRLLRSMPPGPVCIIGADIPGVTRAHVARAFFGAWTQRRGVRPGDGRRLLAGWSETGAACRADAFQGPLVNCGCSRRYDQNTAGRAHRVCRPLARCGYGKRSETVGLRAFRTLF